MKYLYHGSNTGGIEVLKPMISLEFVAKVYATDNLAYALVRAGKQLDEIREEYYGPDEPFEIAECYPNAFKHQFNCGGYIYLLDPKDFVYNPVTTEYTSDKEVIPVGCRYVEDIWSEMNKLSHKYKFIYDGNTEYWNGVRGGRDGYLQRKALAKKKMMELRNKQP